MFIYSLFHVHIAVRKELLRLRDISVQLNR